MRHIDKAREFVADRPYDCSVRDYCCSLPHVFFVGSDGFYDTCQLSEAERQKYDSELAPLGYELVPDDEPGYYFVGKRITRNIALTDEFEQIRAELQEVPQ